MLLSFALSGFLLALLGAILPSWDYLVTERYSAAGWLFFALAFGVVTAGELGRRFLPKLQARILFLLGSALAALALIVLNLLPPPVRFPEQLAGWLTIGFAAGLINVSLFATIHGSYRRDPATTLAQAGIYFGAGCLASAVCVGASLHFGQLGQLLATVALVPACFGLFSVRSKAPVTSPSLQPGFREALGEFSKPGAIIFAALLLFQSGSEWTVAGWLPLFLTHRLGISPESSLWMLAFYWLALLLSRIASIYLLAHARHGRILFASAASALLGCLLLAATDNLFGAASAIFLLGAGFAAVYPLLAEKMGSRFPHYHPGVFNSIFSLAMAGGLLFPWFAGLLAERVSMAAIVAIPAAGVFLVVILLLVLWLESKVTGR